MARVDRVAFAGVAAAASAPVPVALRAATLRGADVAGASSREGACFGAGAAAFLVVLAVVARDAGVVERAAATRRRVLAEPSTTTVTPASESARRIFLAWAGVTSADSTVRAS